MTPDQAGSTIALTFAVMFVLFLLSSYGLVKWATK